MKAFSVVSPWGNIIANGQKTLEIRSWQPDTLPMKNIALVQNEIRLTQAGQIDPNGEVVAIVDIVGCKSWVQSECRQAGCDESEFVAVISPGNLAISESYHIRSKQWQKESFMSFQCQKPLLWQLVLKGKFQFHWMKLFAPIV
ncbi:ASCH domain-containing protein [Photobacterium sp. 53610]|uniref:ASCH domain-containing protein n=1 Tax=Photobacterium sp. 53610 TaxID=3102789 RepID=UPI002ED9ECEA